MGRYARSVEETCFGISDWQDEEKKEVSTEVTRQKAQAESQVSWDKLAN